MIRLETVMENKPVKKTDVATGSQMALIFTLLQVIGSVGYMKGEKSMRANETGWLGQHLQRGLVVLFILEGHHIPLSKTVTQERRDGKETSRNW